MKTKDFYAFPIHRDAVKKKKKMVPNVLLSLESVTHFIMITMKTECRQLKNETPKNDPI